MLSCLIGITLLFASLWMSIIHKDNRKMLTFNSLLDARQQKIYSSIVRERLTIYTMGMILGVCLGFSYYYGSGKSDPYRMCKLLMIIFTVKLLFYYIYPKQPLMLYSLKTKEQVDAWADIYTDMKRKWVHSLIVGFLGYILCASV
jgi:hypothetical protein